MDNKIYLYELLANATLSPESEWVNAMRSKYPYFITPSILYYSRNNGAISADEKEELLSHLALNVADRTAMSEIMGEDAERFASFYPGPEPAPACDTDSTIDNFLSRYGADDNREISALEHCIFNPVPEFTLTEDLIEEDSTQAKSEQEILIDSFLAKGPIPKIPLDAPQPPAVPSADPEPPALPIKEPIIEESLSESLAKVYIRQKKYAKAYDMLEAVAKEHPERNIHINDQLRFLSKLIKLTTPHSIAKT